MSYEIPSELQYHEKIVFGLTMPQPGGLGLALALLFGTASPEILRKRGGKAYQPLDLSGLTW